MAQADARPGVEGLHLHFHAGFRLSPDSGPGRAGQSDVCEATPRLGACRSYFSGS